MKFYSMVGSIKYEVVPTHYEYHGPDIRNREKVNGVDAQFRNHLFDSEDAQRREHWSDETREMVEKYLLAHENFGTAWLDRVADTEAEAKANEFSEKGICISRIVTDEGVVDCEQEAIEGEFYCKTHLPATAKV